MLIGKRLPVTVRILELQINRKPLNLMCRSCKGCGCSVDIFCLADAAFNCPHTFRKLCALNYIREKCQHLTVFPLLKQTFEL